MGKARVTPSGKLVPQSEASVHSQLCKILRLKYGFLLWRTDFAAGMKMDARTAGRHSQLQKGKSWPDMFFAHPVGNNHGLFLELKKHRSEVWNQNGTMVASEHIRDQERLLKHLSGLGYIARFAYGVDHALSIIADYLADQTPPF